MVCEYCENKMDPHHQAVVWNIHLYLNINYSEYTRVSPALPVRLPYPGVDQCNKHYKMLIFGTSFSDEVYISIFNNNILFKHL